MLDIYSQKEIIQYRIEVYFLFLFKLIFNKFFIGREKYLTLSLLSACAMASCRYRLKSNFLIKKLMWKKETAHHAK
jgi:hypothetical protein